ncbi:hypothetical protein ACFX13_039624 [Malus domestica]|uniref:Kinetochore protein SPC25 n=1 Tax=Malus domestica TaxID=3750 RepID=A0A498JMA0_MALDO|nr:hypothetical protein DVH24_008699 [Malus domestica]
MDGKPEESVRTKMESLRMACESEIPIHEKDLDAFTASFRDSLASVRATAQETLQSQGKLGEAKAKLREAEDDLFKALAVKTRKEAKRMALMEAIEARKARIEVLKRTVQDQRAKREEYAAILSQQYFESEENCIPDRKDEIKEAISWYNRVLGFYVEGGHGVKFTFKNISLKNPDQEFCFTVRHANDTYTLLDCDPYLNETKEMIRELNRTNELFKFARDMRVKFQDAAAQGLPAVLPQESSTISGSAPVLSVSTERSESPAKIYDHQVQYAEENRHFKKPNHGKGSRAAILSPASALSMRRSPRLRVFPYFGL